MNSIKSEPIAIKYDSAEQIPNTNSAKYPTIVS